MSREVLPQVIQYEKDIQGDEMMDYLDTENFEFEKEKKALINKTLKNSTDLEAIGHLAKDLNFNIDVKNNYIILQLY